MYILNIFVMFFGIMCFQVGEKMIKVFGEQLFCSGFIYGDFYFVNGKFEGWVLGGWSKGGRNFMGCRGKEDVQGSVRRRQGELGKKLVKYFILLCVD